MGDVLDKSRPHPQPDPPPTVWGSDVFCPRKTDGTVRRQIEDRPSPAELLVFNKLSHTRLRCRNAYQPLLSESILHLKTIQPDQKQRTLKSELKVRLASKHLNVLHLLSTAVGLSCDVTGEHLEDALFTQQLLPPHLEQGLFGGLALQVEQVIVIELTECWR